MKTITFTILLFISIISGKVISQTDTLKENADTIDYKNNFQEEILLEENQSDEDNSGTLDFLEKLRKNPFDLNKVTLSELNNIPFLNSIISKNIIDYRNENKTFKSKRALLNVNGITEELYEKIKIYFIVRQTSENTNRNNSKNQNTLLKLSNTVKFKTRLRTKFIQDLQIREGFMNGKYEGSKPKIYNQIYSNFMKNDLKVEANVTLEKDAGEKNITDFVSGYVQYSNNKFLQSFVAGDYSLNFAQGLALWSNASFSKGADAVTPLMKKGKNIDGYGSVNETQFFRGAAAKFKYKNYNLNLFYSDNYYDATIYTSDTNIDEISGFYFDGYHRTSTEIKRNNSAKEKLVGGRFNYVINNLNIGMTYWKSKFSKPVISSDSKKLFKFSGTEANMLGADYNFIYKNLNLYGEFARSQTGSIASINAMQITFFRFADILFSYRNYPMDFAPVHSSGFGEKSGNTINERGFYAGISIKPIKGIYINSYFDQFEFPYRTYSEPVSTSGNDFLTNIEWRAGKGIILNLKYKSENKEESRETKDEFGRDVKRIDNRNQLNVRAGFIYQMTDRFRFRSRFEYVNVDYDKFGGDNKGTLFYSDVRIIPFANLSLSFRYIIFNTDDYDSRIYEFENDIEGVMSNIALYGKGRRMYLILNYEPLPNINISGKYAETYLDGVKSIGSGNDEIFNNINNRFSIGAEIQF